MDATHMCACVRVCVYNLYRIKSNRIYQFKMGTRMECENALVVRLFSEPEWFPHNICHDIGTFQQSKCLHSSSTNSVNYSILRWENADKKERAFSVWVCVCEREGETSILSVIFKIYILWMIASNLDANFNQIVGNRFLLFIVIAAMI